MIIRLIEALNFRCLHYVRQPLGRFHILVGPNASGKTTFLDVVAFLGRLVDDGVEAAVGERTDNFQDLVWGRNSDWFELAIEAEIPPQRVEAHTKSFCAIRYEVRIGLGKDDGALGILDEKAWLVPAEAQASVNRQRSLFPSEPQPPDTILTGKAKPGWQRILSKAYGGNDNFYVEVRPEGAGKGWFPSIRLGPRKSALGNLPEDETKFPAATWFKQLLTAGVQSLVLNSHAIRRASPPGRPRTFEPDGSNLPWVVAELSKRPLQFKRWVQHVRTALPEIEGIRSVERADDKHRYLMLRYSGGLDIPSWMASDGTLRLLGLTIPAYVPDFQGVYLVEEPENGIHPLAVQTVLQSLESVYGAQVLLATHSPVIVSLAKASEVLCFSKTERGETDIVPGSQHPNLSNWQGQKDLGTLFAAGVLS